MNILTDTLARIDTEEVEIWNDQHSEKLSANNFLQSEDCSVGDVYNT